MKLKDLTIKKHIDERIESFEKQNYEEIKGIYHHKKGDLPVVIKKGYEIGKESPYLLKIDVILDGNPNYVIPTEHHYKDKNEWEEEYKEFLNHVTILK